MEMVRFQDMPYVRPDMEALKAAYQETIEKLKSAASYEEARSAFFALQEAEDRRATMAVLCSVRNTIDTTDAYYDGEMKWLRTENASLIPLRKGYQEALATSPFRPQFEAEFGKQMFRLIDAGLKTSDERIIPAGSAGAEGGLPRLGGPLRKDQPATGRRVRRAGAFEGQDGPYVGL